MDPLMLLNSRPFRTRDAIPLLSKDVVVGPRYQRLMHGAHHIAGDEVEHGRVIQGFRVTHEDPFVLLGPSAAWAHGACFAAREDPVVVAIPSPHRLARTAEVTPHLARLSADDVVTTALGPATTLERTAVDLARGVGNRARSLDERVADVDALVRATSLTPDTARAAAAACHRLRGLPMARQVLSLCRDGVDSHAETRLRLLVVRAGLPEPMTQCPVMLPDGRVVARLDLGWPDARVGCEYDGQVHLDPRQVRSDLRRHNRIREAGWVVLQVDRHQMRNPDEVVRQLLSLLAV